MRYYHIILDTVYSSKYKGYGVEEWKHFLNIETNEQFVQLMKDLNELEASYMIIRDAKNKYYTLESQDCFIGTLRINPKGFGFVENEEISVYANKTEIRKALDQDQVLAKIIYERDGSKECKILRVVSHNKKSIVGSIKKRGNKFIFLSDNYIGEHKIKITNLNEFKLVNDTKVMVKIDKITSETLFCSIISIIGHKYDPGVDVLSILLEHDIESDYPYEVLEETNKIKDFISDEEKIGRENFTNEMVITIDGDDSKDFDDAIHVKKYDDYYELGVHIADVSHYVKENSALDKEAYKRGTSVYVVDRVVAMLPHALSNGICSLNPKVERLTLSCVMKIDLQGNMIDYRIVPSYIKSFERMTYNNVNKILNKDDKLCRKYEHLLIMINWMHELSLIIRKKRHEQGNINFDTKESKILVDKQGKVKDIVLRERGESEQIIEDFMISANECVAAHMKNLDLPGVYRVHETPDVKKMREFASVASSLGYKLKGDLSKVYPKQLQRLLEKAKDSHNYNVLSSCMLRSMQKARYDINCLGHFGLALNEYTHFTSPIRRYPDLIVHRMLRKYFFQTVEDVKIIQEDHEWTQEAAYHSSQKERNAIEAERDVEAYKKCEYMERYVGSKFTGIVSSITKFGMFVELENTVEGLIHISNMKDDYYHYEEAGKVLIGERSGKIYRMGDSVRVKVIEANKFKKQIDFEIVKR